MNLERAKQAHGRVGHAQADLDEAAELRRLCVGRAVETARCLLELAVRDEACKVRARDAGLVQVAGANRPSASAAFPFALMSGNLPGLFLLFLHSDYTD